MRERSTGTTSEYPTIPLHTARLKGHALGIDIGGTGIKAAVVDLATGRLVTDRVRELTPRPAPPEAVIGVLVEVIRQLDASGKLTADMPGGAGFPSVMRAGTAMTAVHGDPSWIGVSVQQLLEERLGRPIRVLNDADAAGVAEIAYGAGKAKAGVVLLVDLGTGIGSALSIDGRLVPNTQLGHIEIDGREAEARLSPVARIRRRISWSTWAKEFNTLLARWEEYVSPDLIILGGGTAKDFPKFGSLLKTRADLVVATLGTSAGIIGAARVAAGTAA